MVVSFAASLVDELALLGICADDFLVASLDLVFGLLSSGRRRRLLYRLDGARVVTVEELAAHVAAEDLGVPVAEVGDEHRERVEAELLANHLPRLEDAGVLEYDRRSGDVVPADRIDDLRPYLERAREQELTDGQPAD